MSAQKSPRRGAFSAAVGVLGFSAIAGLLVTVMVAPALAVTGVTASSTIGIFDSLPEYITIDQQPERNDIYATFTGEGNEGGYLKIATIYDQNRQEVPYDQISQFALDAAVAGEDRRFFEHGGVDVASVVRAAIGNVASSDIESGASTLSMQLVKQIFVQEALEKPTEDERRAAYDEATATSFDRKLREMKLAIGLEKRYTKKEILTAYLNIAFFGSNTYGIQAAAQRYYSVNAKDLTLPQAASLIAIVQYPALRALNDPENFSANEDRRDVILFSMLDVGDITQQEYEEAYDSPVDETTLLPSSPTNGCVAAFSHAKWFCDYVVKSVKDFEFLGASVEEREKNWKRGGYKLYTTLDLDAQIPAQEATWTYAPNTETAFSLGSATASVQGGTGRVLVMTENMIFNDTLEGGGPTTSAVNYNTSFDYGGSTGFQPGSTYKTFVLLEWLNQNKGINERVLGDGRTIPGAQFRDSCNGPWGGPVTFKNNSGEKGIYDIRVGSVESINGAFFSMALQLDLCKIKNVAEGLGVERADYGPLQTNPASIIGTNEVTPLSMAGAYAAIGAGGVFCKSIIVDRAIAPNGTELPGQARECRQAISPEVAATAAFVLEGVPRTGNARFSNPDDGIPLLGKTGTTDGATQTWMAAATTSVGTVVWVGNSIGFQDILRTSYADVSGIRLRHFIMRPTLAALNIKYGGNAFPAPPAQLLTGSGLEVPPVIGRTLEQAKPLLEGLGFVFADGGQVDSEAPAGTIVATDPAPGTRSAKGVTVTVFTSRGNKVKVPDVVEDGETNDYATAGGILLAAGFTNVLPAACLTVLPGDSRVGKVTAMGPAAGTFILRTDPITLTVAQDTLCVP